MARDPALVVECHRGHSPRSQDLPETDGLGDGGIDLGVEYHTLVGGEVTLRECPAQGEPQLAGATQNCGQKPRVPPAPSDRVAAWLSGTAARPQPQRRPSGPLRLAWADP